MRLLIFTRYPTAGTVKTRLIPALGVYGAQKLHRKMAEDTIKKLKSIKKIEVYFDGGNEKLMREWLGEGVPYWPQGPGGLGERLFSGFSRAFLQGEDGVVAVGTDCPGIALSHVKEAFLLLNRYDLVLGPAADGGYYLLGMRKLHKSLFEDIPWGSSRVLQETLKKAELIGLKTASLETMADVDRPEDLALLDKLFL